MVAKSKFPGNHSRMISLLEARINKLYGVCYLTRSVLKMHSGVH